MCKYSINRHKSSRIISNDSYHDFIKDVGAFHRSLPEYSPTPLIELTNLARVFGVKNIFVKDESLRFGLKAFKAMGASYAIFRYIKTEWEKTFGVQFASKNLFDKRLLSRLNLPPLCCATDGNHGRAVAWMAKLIGLKAVIYVPKDTAVNRIENIKNEKAEVIIIDGDYDRAVSQAADDAQENGWKIISDTSYEGYLNIPGQITLGYSTIFGEIDPELKFDIIILQGGVGSFAASAVDFYRNSQNNRFAKLVTVEPTEADCLLASSQTPAGNLTVSNGSQKTIMAGLNCATPSIIAWDTLRDNVDLFLAISDDFTEKAMKQFYKPIGNDEKIISGESGAAGLAALTALLENNKLKKAGDFLNLGINSNILIFNTEGDTDPDNFSKIVSNKR